MNKKSSFATLLSTVDKMSTSFKPDESIWKIEQDRAGNGQAVIRFLPEREGAAPFVRIYTHAFKTPGDKWFIDNCPTTLNDKCPICEANSKLWAEGTEAAKKIVRDRKRKLSYFANILVVSDPKNPENEGKVFKFKFGKKIFDMLVDKIKPAFEGDEPLNPFDPYTGANFKIRIQKKDGFPNYDKSSFEEPSEIGSDEYIESVLSQLHNIEADVAPDKFKSAEELQTKFDRAMTGVAAPKADDDMEDVVDVPKATVRTEKKPAKPMPKVNKDDDSDEEYFKSLMDE